MKRSTLLFIGAFTFPLLVFVLATVSLNARARKFLAGKTETGVQVKSNPLAGMKNIRKVVAGPGIALNIIIDSAQLPELRNNNYWKEELDISKEGDSLRINLKKESITHSMQLDLVLPDVDDIVLKGGSVNVSADSIDRLSVWLEKNNDSRRSGYSSNVLRMRSAGSLQITSWRNNDQLRIIRESSNSFDVPSRIEHLLIKGTFGDTYIDNFDITRYQFELGEESSLTLEKASLHSVLKNKQ
jgi:hypothetical protein